jgi:hypothetical protein
VSDGGRVIHERKSDAVESGQALAKSLKGKFIVKNQIAEKNSYGNDPRNVPG